MISIDNSLKDLNFHIFKKFEKEKYMDNLLEQIFYKFEAEKGKIENNNVEEKDMSIEVDNNKKGEIVIDDDVYNSLI